MDGDEIALCDQRRDDALEALAKAGQLAPNETDDAYAYELTLRELGRAAPTQTQRRP
jgi:hypothetical protein